MVMLRVLEIGHGFNQICHGLDLINTYMFHLNIDSLFEAACERTKVHNLLIN